MSRHAKNPGFRERLEKRRMEAFELRAKGLSYRKIGALLSVNESQAYRYVQAVLRRTRQMTDECAQAYRALECERLDKALSVAMQDLHDPDPRVHLAAIDRIVQISDRRAKLLGFDSPKAIELSGPGGGAIQHEHRNAAYDEETILAAAEEIRFRRLVEGECGTQSDDLCA